MKYEPHRSRNDATDAIDKLTGILRFGSIKGVRKNATKSG